MTRSGTPTTARAVRAARGRLIDDPRVDRSAAAPDHMPALGECWVWTGAHQSQGYGMVSVGGRVIGAHRLSWIEANGPIPHGQCVMHLCDNPPCIRPSHLQAGTYVANARDRKAKGRSGKPLGPARETGRTKPVITISISDDANRKLSAIAEERGQSRSGAVEQLVRNARMRDSR